MRTHHERSNRDRTTLTTGQIAQAVIVAAVVSAFVFLFAFVLFLAGPRPASAQVHPDKDAIIEIIHEAAATHGVNGYRMVDIAGCETGYRYNPDAYNDAGPYYGIFQFDETTWNGGSSDYKWMSWYDPWASAHMAAWYMAREGYGRWPVCQYR